VIDHKAEPVDTQNTNKRRKWQAARGPVARFARLLRARLIVPTLRGVHTPEHTARAVGIGLAVALTPTSGIQMSAVVGIWLMLRKLKPAWDFNLLVALAWTWVTNPVTIPPLYYLYIVTGRVLLGRWEKLRGYETFERRITETLAEDTGLLKSLWIFSVNLFEKFGVPILVGSLPWIALGTWLGYRWSFKLMQRIYEARKRRHAAVNAAKAFHDGQLQDGSVRNKN